MAGSLYPASTNGPLHGVDDRVDLLVGDERDDDLPEAAAGHPGAERARLHGGVGDQVDAALW